MAELGNTIIYGDLKVTGKVSGESGDIGGGAGGITKDTEGLGLTSTADTGAIGGKVYSYTTTANTAAANIIIANFENLLYGAYSVMIRLKLSNVTSTANLIKLESFHVDGTTETLLNTAYIKPSDLTSASLWNTCGFVTEFKGSSGNNDPILRVKLSIVANATANTLGFDYFRVAPSYTSIVSLPTV